MLVSNVTRLPQISWLSIIYGQDQTNEPIYNIYNFSPVCGLYYILYFTDLVYGFVFSTEQCLIGVIEHMQLLGMRAV